MKTNKKKSETTKLFLTFVSSFQFRTTIFAHKSANKRKRKKTTQTKLLFLKIVCICSEHFFPHLFLKPAIKNKKNPKFWYFFSILYENICSEKVNTSQKRKTENKIIVSFALLHLYSPIFYPPNVSRTSHFTSNKVVPSFCFFSIPYDILCSKKMNTNENKNSKTILFFLTFVSSFQYRTTIFAHKKCIQTKTKKRRQNYCSLKSYVTVQGIFYPK